MPRIFISHATPDKDLVDRFVDLLHTGVGVSVGNIFCTSVESLGIETGKNFIERILVEIRESDLVILMLSKNYKSNQFCLAEFGATWALDKPIFPFTVKGVGRDPGNFFTARQSHLLDQNGLDNLRDYCISKSLISEEIKTPRWNVKSKRFLEEVEEIIDNLPCPHHVSIEDFEKLERELASITEYATEIEEELEEKKKEIEEIRDLKDQEELEKYDLESMDIFDRWDEQVSLVRESVNDFSYAAQEAIISHFGDDWCPDRMDGDLWKEIRDDMSSHILYEDYQIVYANRNHPRVEKAISEIEKLREILELEDDEKSTLSNHLRKKYNCIVDVSSAEFLREIFNN